MEPHLDAVPENRRGANFWHFVGTWAFLRRQRDLLDDAFGHFATERPIEYADWFYFRLMLMRRLLEGTATAFDVTEALKRLKSLTLLTEFRRTILPDCETAGLCQAKVQKKLDALGARFSARAKPAGPTRSRKPRA